jgi:hypothetical protein
VHQSVPHRHRLFGLAIPLVVYAIMWSTNTAAAKEDRVRIASQGIDAQLEARAVAANWLNRSALYDVYPLAECVEKFRGDSIAGRAPKSLRALQKWANDPPPHDGACAFRLYEKHRDRYGFEDDSLPSDTLPHPRQGDIHHVLYYRPPTDPIGKPFQAARFTLGIQAVWDSAEFPNAHGMPGARSYLLDPDGNIHVTAEHRRATLSDSIIPVCGRDQQSSDQRECRRPFLPRQRWGVTGRLPIFSVSVRPMGASSDSIYGNFPFIEVNALDSVRSVSVDWGDGRKATVAIPPSRSSTWSSVIESHRYVNHYDLTLTHVYKEAGQKIVRARLLTRSGAEYLGADTTFVETVDHR